MDTAELKAEQLKQDILNQWESMGFSKLRKAQEPYL